MKISDSHVERRQSAGHPPLLADRAHVWRIALDDPQAAELYWPVLSADEQARAKRFYTHSLRLQYTVAHGALRHILAGYVGESAESLVFAVGEHGKPHLAPGSAGARSGIEFNLSHSGDLALVAVTRDRPVGVDLERWAEGVDQLELAERFFSPDECVALRRLASSSDQRVSAGFFAAWTRKEAYLKATGHGIARGLRHFDVSLAPDDRAQLLADRLDSDATKKWSMVELVIADGYSGALVAAAPLTEALLFDWNPLRN
jgi:4'-phosphopantetheinyl transferase